MEPPPGVPRPDFLPPAAPAPAPGYPADFGPPAGWAPPGGPAQYPGEPPPDRPVNRGIIALTVILVIALVVLGLTLLVRHVEQGGAAPTPSATVPAPSAVVVPAPSAVPIPGSSVTPPAWWPIPSTVSPQAIAPGNLMFCMQYSVGRMVIDTMLAIYPQQLQAGNTYGAQQSVASAQSMVQTLQQSDPPDDVAATLTQMGTSLDTLADDVSRGQDWSVADRAAWDSAYTGFQNAADVLCPS